MPNQNHKHIFKGFLILATFLLIFNGKSFAFDPSHYAESSALSQGNWAKVEVTETGMQFISDAALRNLGFSDPEKVNVFGYGGVVIPENLNSPDDLPLVSSLRVNGGVIFFGKASVGWDLSSDGNSVYKHSSHPYSDNSYYFISDCLPERHSPEKAETLASSGEPITIFTERLLHEQELTMPMNTGRLVLGEDFKATPSRSFKFSLPGNTGNAVVTTAFGCKTASGTSSISLTANGKQLAATDQDKLPFSSSKLIVTTTTVKEVENPGASLDITIKYNPSGQVSIAALNYIEVEYPRSIAMDGGELYFYISPEKANTVQIKGATAATKVWDVSDLTSIKELETSLSGSTLSFVSEPGYHEYVAFEPSMVTRPVTPSIKISNQDIHSQPAPGMLVICPTEFMNAAQRLVNLHQKLDGLEILVVTPEEVYNEFSSGKPDVSAFRKLLKMWYDRAEGRAGEYPAYCLIMGRPSYDNKLITPLVKNCGYPRVPIWQSPTGETETTSYSTDDYIGMLKDVKGTFSIGTAEIHVAVGRMPFMSQTDINNVFDKLESYLLDPDLGAWRNNVMVIADDQDNGVHIDQAESVVGQMRTHGKGNDFLIEKLYLDAYPLEYTGTGAAYPQAHARLLNKWKEGMVFIDYIGHANPKSWGHEGLLTWTDITSMDNTRLPFIYAATCEFMRWDADDISGAEVLWSMPKSGVIGMISPSREVLIAANGVLNKSMAKFIFETDEQGRAISCGDIMRLGKNDSNTGTNKLRYALIGDPSMRLPWPMMNVVVDKINGVELENAETLPVLSARSNAVISGHIRDYQGNPIEDFNGIAEVALYDAEKVITTNGNGSEGIQSIYNDRKTRLFIGRTKVTDGKWEISFTMPSEIENNFSPALLSLYAYDSTGREANGACESLYAYGYDSSAPDDYEGPKMIEFYLNTPAFVNGSQVSPNPTLVAKFYDESGISVSEAGIGHNITLNLDGKVYYDDVAQYYLPDENEANAGSVSYALGQVAQGNHTLTFTVWDNANNSTTATLDFSISALWKPSIEMLTTDVNPATSNVNFIVATDGSTSSMECMIDVYNVWGRKVWSDKAPNFSNASTQTSIGWNLCDFSGARIPGGVYLYKATVKTESGATVSKTKKLIVKGL